LFILWLTAGCGYVNQLNQLNARIKELEVLVLLRSAPTSPELTLEEGGVNVSTASPVCMPSFWHHLWET
jgi:hypothetical protein